MHGGILLHLASPAELRSRRPPHPVDWGSVPPPLSKPIPEARPTVFWGTRAERRDNSIFICSFIKQELLHDNLIQYLLAISVEKIISLYIQKYRFEQ